MTTKQTACRDELLPCPFCGDYNLGKHTTGIGSPWFITCGGCGAQMKAKYYTDVVKDWNTRAPLEAVMADLEKNAGRPANIWGRYVSLPTAIEILKKHMEK